MASTRTTRAVAGTITSFLQYALIILLQVLLAPVVLRIAGQEVLGAYSLLMQIISWAALTDLGFGVAIGRYLSQAIGIDDQRKRFCTIFVTGRTFYIASNIAFSVIILIISWNITKLVSMSHSVESEARLALILLAAWVAIRTPFSLYNDALSASQNLASVNIIVAIGAALRLILSLCMIILGAGLMGLMLANIIAEAVTCIAGRQWYRRLYPDDKLGWGIPDRSLFKEIFGFGMTYMVTILAGRLSASTDSIIVGYLYGAAAVSIYYTSQIPGTMLYQLIWKLTDNSAPALNELHARGATSQLANVYLRLFRYNLLMVIPLALGVVAFNRHVITLWVGTAQYAGDILTIALALFAVTQVIIHFNAILLMAFSDIRVMSMIFLSTGIAKLIIALLLGRIIGLQGVMIANILADIPGFIYLSYRVWLLLGLTTRQIGKQAIIPALTSSLLAILVVFVVVLQKPATSWISFSLLGSLFSVAWAIGVWMVGLKSDERMHLIYFFKRILGRAPVNANGM